MKTKLLIYGATGYTAGLVIAEALSTGLQPVLAGRSTSVKAIAEQHQLDYRIFDLSDIPEIVHNLSDIKLILNLAGPFSQTQTPLLQACLQTQTHYTDIAGEVPEFENVNRSHSDALREGIMLMPGAGFGIAPTDALALYLKKQLPDAQQLTIGFVAEGGVSKGTLKTVIKDLCKPGVILIKSQFKKSLPAEQQFDAFFEGKKYKLVTNPWRADLFTATRTTGVTSVATFSHFPPPLVFVMKNGWLFERLLQSKFVQNQLAKAPAGPQAEALSQGKTYLYGKAENATGKTAEAWFKGEEAYIFTAKTTVLIVKEVLKNNFQPGFQTPAGLYYDLLLPLLTAL